MQSRGLFFADTVGSVPLTARSPPHREREHGQAARLESEWQTRLAEPNTGHPHRRSSVPGISTLCSHLSYKSQVFDPPSDVTEGGSNNIVPVSEDTIMHVRAEQPSPAPLSMLRHHRWILRCANGSS